ncbi:dinuclear metal center YbgI/SA1388 family protein [Virgibacillus natechei]|uniref:GTP cyclohydrolase 1 type 2 homolog n=1 Tax=Virgibacillus natechei TaxID=1216297 RepID=A0ABS4ICL7_9BACI|nr:Nif3-like dinuclear metal center hexameric protein [Virgibacillus natechei]MBP1968688.1 dinuclear metal center YbgI/SA1388 family protein [Virgibacillus natechei]UZD11490.1 Nif3-like dinuclear metal center hexameric protein [Virgibacillus natechei]
MTKTNLDIFRLMEEWAPLNLAYEWDNVGLQIGSYTNSVKKIMVTLDVLESVVDEAIDNDIDLIIAHHPLLFKPIKEVNIDTPHGRIIHKLIQHNISVYASHTNLDIANGGVNDMLADLLNLQSQDVLVETKTEKLFKISVSVPKSHKNDVLEAFNNSGAGHIGDYSNCTFQIEGQGTFKPLEGTAPHIGTQNELEIVDEIKVETIVQEGILANVVHAMIEAHPYEEAAYDIFPLHNQGEVLGLGRMGTLDKQTDLETFCKQVKYAFDISHMRITGDLTKKINKVAILGGSGEKYINAAKQKGADVYITGDMTFHTAQTAWQMGLSLIDPGHYIEKVMKKATKQYLDDRLQSNTVEVMISESNTEPFQFI